MKRKKLILVATTLVTTTLVSCADVSSIVPTTSEFSSSESSTSYATSSHETNSSTSGGGETTTSLSSSSSSSVVVENFETEFAELQKEYTSQNLVTRVSGTSTYYHYEVISSGQDELYYDDYVASDTEASMTEDNLNKTNLYTHHLFGGDEKEKVASLSLDITNNVQYDVVRGDFYWDDVYISNPFTMFDASDFTTTDDINYSLKLDLLDKGNAYQALKNHLYITSLWSNNFKNSFTLSSYVLKYEDKELTGFNAEFTSEDETISYAVSGEFSAYGDDAFSKVSALSGQEDNLFSSYVNEIAKQNYTLDITYYKDKWDNNSKYWEYQVADSGKVCSYEYYKGSSDGTFSKLTGSGFTYQAEDGKVGTTYKIGDKYYRYGEYSDGSIDYLPDFNLSSLFFIKDETASIPTYSLRTDLGSFLKTDKQMYLYSIVPTKANGGFNFVAAPQTIGNITVTIDETNKVFTLVNKVKVGSNNYVITIEYKNIGSANVPAVSQIGQNVDDLTWEEVLANQSDEYATFKQFAGENVINAIPTVGGIYPKFTLSLGQSGTTPFVTIINELTADSCATTYSSYIAKLEANGFEQDSSIANKWSNTVLYKKVVGEKTLVLEVLSDASQTKSLYIYVYFAD